MNSRSSQPADLLSPSLCPTSLQKSLMSSRKTLRTSQGFWFENVGNKWEMVLKKASRGMRRRIMKKRGFVSCQPTISSWLSPIRQGSKYENFKPSRESDLQFCCYHWPFWLLPKALQSAENFTHDLTHIPQQIHSHPVFIFLGCHLNKTCWVKKTGGKSDAIQVNPPTFYSHKWQNFTKFRSFTTLHSHNPESIHPQTKNSAAPNKKICIL